MTNIKTYYPDDDEDDDFEDDDFEPEDFDPEIPAQPGPLSKFPKLKHIRPAVILFMLFYTASVLHSGYPVGDKLWASGDSVYKNHEYWRIITSVFIHDDIYHLLSNALIFIIFGWILRAYFGFFVFPVLSLIIGAACTLLTITIYDPGMRLIGASGMNYGMAALWLVFYLRFDTDNRPARKILRVFGFILAVLFPSTYNPQVSYLAHALGFALGLTAGILLLPFVKVREPV
jgi:rhomboid protease GluP